MLRQLRYDLVFALIIIIVSIIIIVTTTISFILSLQICPQQHRRNKNKRLMKTECSFKPLFFYSKSIKNLSYCSTQRRSIRFGHGRLFCLYMWILLPLCEKYDTKLVVNFSDLNQKEIGFCTWQVVGKDANEAWNVAKKGTTSTSHNKRE